MEQQGARKRGARINLIMKNNLHAGKNIFAGAVGAWLFGVVVLFSASGTVVAKDATLYIQRNDAGSVLQLIPLDTWSFDKSRRLLRAKSVAGGLECSGKAVTKKSSSQLVLDGKAYAVDHINEDATGHLELTVQPAGSDLFPLCVNESVSVLSTKSNHTLTLEFQDLASFGTVRGPLSTGTTIDFNLSVPIPRATARLSSANPTMICFAPPSTSALNMHLRDKNGVFESISGVGALTYLPFGDTPVGTPNNTLRIGAVNGLYCLPLPATGLPRLTQADADFTMAECPPIDSLFAGGFENNEDNTPGVGGLDLILDLRLDAAPTPVSTDPMRYEIYVKNCSTTDTATNVQVRDFFPVNRGNVNPADGLLQDAPGSSLTCLVDGANRACTAETIFDPVNGPVIPYLTVPIGDLGPGQVARVGISRTAEAPTTGLPTIRMNAAVTSDVMDETSFGNNSGSWDVAFLDTNNLLPTLNLGGTAANLTEDDGATQLTGSLIISAVDNDGTVVDVSASSSNQTLIANSDIQVNFTNLNDIKLTVTPVADAFGTVTLTVTATDNLGGTDMKTVDVTINPVNDPPSLVVKGGFVYTGGASPAISFSGPNCTENSGAGCANQSYPADVGVLNSADFPAFLDWVVSVAPGPANESGQTVTAAATLQSDPAPSMFLGGSFEPKLSAGTFNLNYGLSGNSGTATVLVTVTDSEVANNTTTLSFDILVDNAAPVVTASQVLQVAENSSGTVGVVAGTDVDAGDTLQSWMIVSGNSGIDGDATVPFAINAVTGEITVNDVDDFDFEQQQQYTLGITVSDGAATSAVGLVTIDVTNVDEAAIAVTDAATAVLSVTATVNGTVTANDSVPATVSFEYGLTTGYGSVAASTSQTGSFPVAVSADLSGLACNALYHYRVTITNTLGTLDGPDGTFTTSTCALPTVSSLGTVAITDATATIQGLVNPNGSDTNNIKFSYGIGLAGITDNMIAATPATLLVADGETQVTANLTGLSCGNINYRFVLEATNSAGTTDGAVIGSFNTAACP